MDYRDPFIYGRPIAGMLPLVSPKERKGGKMEKNQRGGKKGNWKEREKKDKWGESGEQKKFTYA